MESPSKRIKLADLSADDQLSPDSKLINNIT